MNNLEPASVDFSVLFERDLDAGVIVDSGQRIHHVNAAFTRLFGYTREECVGWNIDDLIVPPELRAEAIRSQEETRQGHHSSVETTRRTKDGEFVDVCIVASLCEVQGRQPVYYVQYRDISERVSAVEQLNRKRAELRTIVENAPIGIALIDLEHGLFEANTALENMLGYSRGELIGCSMRDVVHREDREKVLSIRDELLRTNATVRLTTRMVRKDETTLWARVASSVVRSTIGEPLHLIVVVEDVTKDLALEASTRESQKAEAVSKLAGGIAHDFNNILTALQGHAMLLLDEAALDEQARTDVEEIIRGAHRAATLTRQLLAYSRSQVMSPEPVRVNDAIRRLEGTLKTVLGGAVRLELMLEPDVGGIRVDLNQFEHVILHLALNARDAMPNGGALRIATLRHALTAGAGMAGDLPPGEYVEISVQDEGVGMDAATAARVFDPFFTTKEPGRGTGLGLSMAYGIIRQSGGSISVESEVGKRTTFRILLPLLPGYGE